MELKFILEALLFNAQKPLSASELRELLVATAKQEESADAPARAFKKTTIQDITAALESLEKEHAAAQRSFRLACVAGAWQFVSQPEYASWLRVLVGEKPRPPRLSQAALETLAIIAYRQPITRAEMEQIRGVSVDGVMATLVERGLVVALGRAEVIGRPVTYGTTSAFLEYFGLGALADLPDADELRRIEVQRPEPLATVEQDLPTVLQESAPPSQGEAVAAVNQALEEPKPEAAPAPAEPPADPPAGESQEPEKPQT